MYSTNFKNVAPDSLPNEQIGDTKVINICGYLDAQYGDSDPDWDVTGSDLRAWLTEHNVHYYGEPKESFSTWTASREAERAGHTFVVVEDMS